MPTDHDRIITIEGTNKELLEDIDDMQPRLRRVEDILLELKTVLMLAKVIAGLASVSVVVHIAL